MCWYTLNRSQCEFKDTQHENKDRKKQQQQLTANNSGTSFKPVK